MKKRKLTTTQKIVLGFLQAIIVGAFLLCLPISSAAGQWTSFLDAFFTATTSVCVTGLVVVDTYAHWSFFGQAVILILIQLGGLGIVTFTAGVAMMANGKGTLQGRLLLEDSFNLSSMHGLSGFIRKTVAGTFLVELAGAVCCCFVFIPAYGAAKGIWCSVFHAVSSFCNAGIDLIGSSSLTGYAGHVWLNAVTMLLIILGGLGFIVWWDTLRVAKRIRSGEIPVRQGFRRLSLHSKLVYLMTGVLILSGAALVFVLEYDNPATLGNMGAGEKVMASLFQSVTLRTAGFFTFSQKAMKDVTAVVCMVFMFIGGSPVGTAGGVKTTTAALIWIAALSTARGSEEAVFMKRTVPNKAVRKALAVVTFSLAACTAASVLLCIVSGADFIDAAYEAVSALGTVGLSRNLTASLNDGGKLLVAVCMFLGRIGPISIVMAFNTRQGKRNSRLEFSKEEITVG